MYKLFAVFVIAFLASESMAMSPRLRRQAVTSSTTATPTTEAAQAQGQSTTTNGQNAAVQQCLVTCPVTAEYNPVCGSNGVTYSNPGRLLCSQACGENVSLQRTAPCPRT